jgi:hypothetical protein
VCTSQAIEQISELSSEHKCQKIKSKQTTKMQTNVQWNRGTSCIFLGGFTVNSGVRASDRMDQKQQPHYENDFNFESRISGQIVPIMST